jgi:hypothetical protein
MIDSPNTEHRLAHTVNGKAETSSHPSLLWFAYPSFGAQSSQSLRCHRRRRTGSGIAPVMVAIIRLT